MSNIIRVSELSPNSEWLVMSNQGTDCFLELLLSAADDLEITEHQKELISFLDDQRSVSNVSPIVLPWPEQFGSMVEQMRQGSD